MVDISYVESFVINSDHIIWIYYQDSVRFILEGLEGLHNNIMFYLAIIFSAVNTTMLTIMYLSDIMFFLLIWQLLIIMYYSVCIFLFVGWVMLSLVWFWGCVLLFVGLVLSIVLFLALILDEEHSAMLIGTFFLAYILLVVNSNMLNVISYIDLIILTVNYVVLSILMTMILNGWASNLLRRHDLTPLGLIWRFAGYTIHLFRTSKEFRGLLVVIWLTFLFLRVSIIPVIEGVKWVIDAHVVFDGKTLMNHYITLEMQEYIGAFNDICSDKLLMNIDDLLNTGPQGLGPLEGPPVPPLVPPAPPAPLVPFATHEYFHKANGVTREMIEDLSNRADQIGFFRIREIYMAERSCIVDFYGPVPDWNDIARMELLKQFHSYFPYGNTYQRGSAPHTLHDPYRTEAYILKRLEAWSLDPNIAYISDEQRPLGLSPYYDHANREQYDAWAKDIAGNIVKYRRDHGIHSVPKLDAYSEIFLASFRNAREELSPTNYHHYRTLRALRSLRE